MKAFTFLLEKEHFIYTQYSEMALILASMSIYSLKFWQVKINQPFNTITTVVI